MSEPEERLISITTQGVLWKQTSDMSTETMPQGVFGNQTSDISTENSSGESTTCKNHLIAAQTKAFIVNKMNKTEEQIASIMQKWWESKHTRAYYRHFLL